MLTSPTLHAHTSPSEWVRRWAHLIPAGERVLDLACGHGRHMQWLQLQGFDCLGVDRDPLALQTAAEFGEVLQADLEKQPWPLNGHSFAAVVVTHYLWRSLWPDVLACLQPGGVLIYETFAIGNESVGKPSNPDFLLRHGELLQVCQGLRVIAYEDGVCLLPDRFVQRIVSVKAPLKDGETPPRYLLPS